MVLLGNRNVRFYCKDKLTGSRTSLKTADRQEAELLVQPKNEATKNATSLQDQNGLPFHRRSQADHAGLARCDGRHRPGQAWTDLAPLEDGLQGQPMPLDFLIDCHTLASVIETGISNIKKWGCRFWKRNSRESSDEAPLELAPPEEWESQPGWLEDEADKLVPEGG